VGIINSDAQAGHSLDSDGVDGLIIEQRGGTVGRDNFRGSTFNNTVWTVNGGTLGERGIDITGGSVFTINSGGAVLVGNDRSFTVNDSSMTFKSGSTLDTTDLSYATNGGLLQIDGGTITGDGTTATGNGIGALSGGTLTVNGGTISGYQEFGGVDSFGSGGATVNLNGGSVTASGFSFHGGLVANFGGTTNGSAVFTDFQGDRHNDANININWASGSLMTLQITNNTLDGGLAASNWAQFLWDSDQLKLDGVSATDSGLAFGDTDFVFDGGTNTLSVIPEPSSIALVGIALAGLIMFHRKNA
jgi:hypothetical protein